MIYSGYMLKDKYQGYSNINAKVKLEVDRGRLFRLKKGIYVDSLQEDPFRCANAMVTPSYVSFETALCYYDMIPERVYAKTSATLLMHKRKEFLTPMGLFIYRDVPKQVFSLGIETTEYGFQIATREKALCDMLYHLPPVYSIKALKELLFEDQRMDEEDICSLSRQDMETLLPLYKANNTRLMLKLLEELPWKEN
ncbi:MAG: hypothetical protein K6B65_00340 [Bacilli bacterium]|nr:hypothetical protein [Bacilli bacterium]